MAAKLEYNITCLSETFLNSSFNLLDDRTNIERNNPLRADHPNNKKNGRVCMYFKKYLPILRRNSLCKLPECLVTEIRMGTKKCFFTRFYRSPSESSDEFATFHSNLNLFLSNINNLNSASSIVIGNFNARTLKW